MTVKDIKMGDSIAREERTRHGAMKSVLILLETTLCIVMAVDVLPHVTFAERKMKLEGKCNKYVAHHQS